MVDKRTYGGMGEGNEKTKQKKKGGKKYTEKKYTKRKRDAHAVDVGLWHGALGRTAAADAAGAADVTDQLLDAYRRQSVNVARVLFDRVSCPRAVYFHANGIIRCRRTDFGFSRVTLSEYPDYDMSTLFFFFFFEMCI